MRAPAGFYAVDDVPAARCLRGHRDRLPRLRDRGALASPEGRQLRRRGRGLRRGSPALPGSRGAIVTDLEQLVAQAPQEELPG